MKLEWSSSAVRASLTVSMAARLFYGLSLDAPEAANSAWLCAPVALALSLPVVWLACRASRSARRALTCPLFVSLALDAAASVEWTAYSESYLAFDHISPIWMTFPLLLVILRCTWLGGNAVGGAARIWIRLFALLMLAVFLCQLPYYNVGWLAPWLGGGTGGILRAGIRAAGWNALLACSGAIVCDEPLSARDVLTCMLFATAAATPLLALRQMMAPVVTAGAVSRSMDIDALLTNGRAPLYLQLPMIVAWFAGMLHLMSYEAIAACGLLRRLLPGARDTACAAAGLAAIFTLALTRAPRAEAVRQALPYLYHALAAASLLAWLLKGRKSECAKSV